MEYLGLGRKTNHLTEILVWKDSDSDQGTGTAHGISQSSDTGTLMSESDNSVTLPINLPTSACGRASIKCSWQGRTPETSHHLSSCNASRNRGDRRPRGRTTREGTSNDTVDLFPLFAYNVGLGEFTQSALHRMKMKISLSPALTASNSRNV